MEKRLSELLIFCSLVLKRSPVKTPVRLNVGDDDRGEPANRFQSDKIPALLTAAT
jgi:hypothetical protein